MVDRPRFLGEAEARKEVLGKVLTITAIIDSRLNIPDGKGGTRRVHDSCWTPDMGDDTVSFEYFEYFERLDVKAMTMRVEGFAKTVIIKDGKAVISTRPVHEIKSLAGNKAFRSLFADFADGTIAEALEEFTEMQSYAEYQSRAHQD